MSDLIEYLRGVAENANLPQYMRDRLTEAAAALEAAREDVAEAKQNGYELGLLAGAQEAERLRGVIARYERKLDAAIEEARGDAERIAFLAMEPVIEGFVGVDRDVYEYACDCAEENGRDEPNDEDHINAMRRLIDAAIDQARGKGVAE